MTIRFLCPSCGTELHAPGETAERTAMCPECRTTTQIPHQGTAAQPDATQMKPKDAATALALAVELRGGSKNARPRTRSNRRSTARLRRITTGAVKQVGGHKSERRRIRPKKKKPLLIPLLLWLILLAVCVAGAYILTTLP